MSNRRLAPDTLQPEKFGFNRKYTAEAKGWIKKYPKGREASAVIPLLMLAQDQEGWVSKPAIEHIAGMLHMPFIRVLEVVTFYTQFQLQPVGSKAHVQVCGTTPCMLRGSEALIGLCKRRIGEQQFIITDDGALSWEEVECQGACVNAPMVMIGRDTYEDLTTERLEEIIDAFADGKGDTIKPGPQIDRVYSAPNGGLTCLANEALYANGAADADKTGRQTGKKAPAGATAKPAKPAATRKAIPARAKKPAPAPALGIASLDDKNRPAAIKQPTTPDDLKLISGVGPKLEGVLHGLGIYTFAQIAKWKKAEREWVDSYLKFKGRIERDQWVKQAKALAKGGEAEYVRVFGKKPR